MSCKFQIMSDLHLETHPSYDYDFPQTAPYLALLGDIGHVSTEHLTKFLVRQLLRYRIVFYLFGNHEPYHLSMGFAKEKLRKFVRTAQRLQADDSTIGEFVFLDKTRFDLDNNTAVLGCTLFTNVPPEQALAVQERLVDFRDILDWDVGDHVEAHLEELQWLNTEVAKVAQLGRKIIVLTHHSPTTDTRSRNPRFGKNEVGSGFATDLSREECWTNQAVVLWAFGHTHYSCDFFDGSGKRVVANQKGYYLIPQQAFRADEVVELDSSVVLNGSAPVGQPGES